MPRAARGAPRPSRERRPRRERGAGAIVNPGRALNRAAVDATGLTKRFGQKLALDRFDLRVERGSLCALLGPNGAGKTTLVRLLTTLLDPDEGTALVAGHDIRAAPHEVRRSIGLVAQDATVDALLTGRENLTMIGELHHLGRRPARHRAAELLGQFSLTDSADVLARDYSGGMRRRLDLAATLVAEPAVLFLDEPTAGLDPRGRKELWDMVDGLIEAGATILLTTQYLEEADRLANDVVVVDRGQVIARGDPRSLKRQLGGDRLRIVITSAADVDAAGQILGALTGSAPVVDHAGATLSAAATGGATAVVAAAAKLDEAGIAIDDIALHQPTLDDVFLALTGDRPTKDGP